MRLSENLWLSEVEHSDTAIKHGIDNTIPFTDENIEALFMLTYKFEVVRRALGDRPLKITSGYRSPKLNKAVKGAKYSRHTQLKALDIRQPKGLPMIRMGSILYTLRDQGILRYVYANSERSYHIDWR